VRFAIKTRPEHTTWAQIRDVWVAADEVSLFESAWNWDHFYPLTGDFAGPNLEAWTMLAALAQATSRIRLGCQVTGMVYRHPAVLANMAASLDVISGGRLELGLGAGWNQEEADAYGIDIGATLTERFDFFDESLEVVTGLLTNETTDFDGRFLHLRGARCEPKPVQRPHPPICIGGGGERRTLRSVARFAQHWNFPGGDAATFRHKVEVIGEHCAAIGRDPATIMTSTHLRLTPDGDVGTLVEQAEQYAAVGLDLGIVYLPPPHTPDVLEPVAKALAHLA
jgi:F420-dependent oxidoreductase-like protein